MAVRSVPVVNLVAAPRTGTVCRPGRSTAVAMPIATAPAIRIFRTSTAGSLPVSQGLRRVRGGRPRLAGIGGPEGAQRAPPPPRRELGAGGREPRPAGGGAGGGGGGPPS